MFEGLGFRAERADYWGLALVWGSRFRIQGLGFFCAFAVLRV